MTIGKVNGISHNRIMKNITGRRVLDLIKVFNKSFKIRYFCFDVNLIVVTNEGVRCMLLILKKKNRKLQTMTNSKANAIETSIFKVFIIKKQQMFRLPHSFALIICHSPI